MDKFRALFSKAFPDEPDTLARIEAEVSAGRAFIEISSSGTSFAVLQPVRDLHIWTVGGDMAGVLEIEESVTRKASAKFDRLTALPSRDNWDRVLADRGWTLEETKPLVKDLG